MVLIDGEEYGGVIADQARESDWRVGSVIDWNDIAPPRSTWRENRHVYDQDRIGPNSCTLATACGCYTDATGHIFEYETLQASYKEATELPHRPLDPTVGRWVGDAFAFVGKKQRDISRAMVKLGSPDYYTALEKGFSLSTGYGGNRAYNRDRNEDSIVKNNHRGSASYYHCIRHVVTDQENNVLIPDNYPQRASNVYHTPEIDKKIEESGNYFNRGYFYFQKTSLLMAKLPEHITKDEATSPETREIIIAREQEISAWFDKKSEMLQLLSISTDDFIQFGRNLIKDDLESFQAFITSSYIEISPITSPIDSFGSFANANQRILMSATTHNDAFVIKGLGFTKASVENPLIDNTQVRSGEKMIIISSLINEEIDRTDMLNMICGPGRPNSFGIVSLTPSFRKANDYKTFGCKIAESNDIHQYISSLKSGNYKDIIVFANRYDGIDLPDKSCQILILDGIPYFNTLADQYEENSRSQSDIVNTKLAQKVEQGLGRSVRGEKDFSAIIILGKNLIKFLKSPLTRDYFSLQTRKQIEIGLKIAELGKNEGSVATIRDLLNQCIKRNGAWKEFYKTEMNKIIVPTNQNEISDLIEKEYEASCLYRIGNKEGAIEIIQSIIDSCLNDEDKGWYLQILARYTYNMSKVDSIELQKAAFQKNQHLLKPKNGIQYKKLNFIDGSRVDSIKKRISTYTSHRELMVEVDGILDNLSFGMQSEKFEEAMKRTGEILGFASQRPDKEFGKGPDNLWKTSDNRYFMIECKNEVLDSRKSIRKTEAGQMNSHCGWFESEYGKDFFVKRILCIPVKRLSQEGNFTHEVEIMRKGMLRKLKLNILGFFKEFKKYSLVTLSNQQIQNALDVNKLGIDDLVSNYSEIWNR